MSILSLTAEYSDGRTVITDSSFTSPLKIAVPFYRNGFTEVMMMAASAGMLEGDIYGIDITVRENASLRFTGQSYTKIFKADKKGAAQRVRLTVEKGGTLIYVPCPLIPFGGSVFDSRTEVFLAEDSRFVMTDIFSSGRVAMNESLAFRSLRSRTAVCIDGKVKFLDNQRLVPGDTDLSGIGFFENYTHMGYLYAYGTGEMILPRDGRTESAVTSAAQGICVRSYADSSEDISELFAELIKAAV